MQHDVLDDEDNEVIEEEKAKNSKVKSIIGAKNFMNPIINASIICQESEVEDINSF